ISAGSPEMSSRQSPRSGPDAGHLRHRPLLRLAERGRFYHIRSGRPPDEGRCGRSWSTPAARVRRSLGFPRAPRPLRRFAPGAPLDLAPAAKLAELVLENLDPVRDQAPVDFELRFAHAPEKAASAALPLQVRPTAHQARRRVLELRELHLELALVTLGALRED